MPGKKENCEQQLAWLTKEFEDFVYVVSHDLKAPVRAMTNLSSWIEEDLGENISDDARSHLHLLKDRAVRLEQMISALGRLSRVGRTDLETGPVSVRECAEAVSQKYAGGQATFDFGPDLPVLQTYPKKLATVMELLFDNAVHFAELKPVNIQIQSEDQGDFIRLTVSDNGPGIQLNDPERIFTIFFRGQHDPEKGSGGPGLGLTLARHIMTFLGGSISLENHPGQGCTFVLLWPKILPNNN